MSCSVKNLGGGTELLLSVTTDNYDWNTFYNTLTAKDYKLYAIQAGMYSYNLYYYFGGTVLTREILDDMNSQLNNASDPKDINIGLYIGNTGLYSIKADKNTKKIKLTGVGYYKVYGIY